MTFAAPTTVTLNGIPALVFSLPSVTPGDAYYLALEDAQTNGAWQLAVSGPGSVSGNTVSFPLESGSVQILANQSAVFALYATTAPSPSPPRVVRVNATVEVTRLSPFRRA